MCFSECLHHSVVEGRYLVEDCSRRCALLDVDEVLCVHLVCVHSF